LDVPLRASPNIVGGHFLFSDIEVVLQILGLIDPPQVVSQSIRQKLSRIRGSVPEQFGSARGNAHAEQVQEILIVPARGRVVQLRVGFRSLHQDIIRVRGIHVEHAGRPAIFHRRVTHEHDRRFAVHRNTDGAAEDNNVLVICQFVVGLKIANDLIVVRPHDIAGDCVRRADILRRGIRRIEFEHGDDGATVDRLNDREVLSVRRNFRAADRRQVPERLERRGGSGGRRSHQRSKKRRSACSAE
jgi:hypothetical protein